MPKSPEDDGLRATLPVQLCYLNAGVQTLLSLDVVTGTTVLEAIRQSGLVAQHPEIDVTAQKVGVFGKICGLDDIVAAGDRIEIYRPLSVDPKVARARRVAKTRKGGSTEGRKWANRLYR